MKLDYPETGTVHLCPQIKKVLFIDFTFKCPRYGSWKSYENAMKSSMVSLTRAWLNRQLTRRVPHAPSSCHQANCPVYKDAVLYDYSTQEEAHTLNDCLEPGLLLQDKV